MAIYTEISFSEVQLILKDYNIGQKKNINEIYYHRTTKTYNYE